ncbi:MAG: hypothetical protein ACKOC5_09350, partial [Chloroflexota bacterium]
MNEYQECKTDGSTIERLPDGGLRLSIPAGPAGSYRVAQIDDYSGLPRGRFAWQAPFRLALSARAAAAQLPGTWGMGLWNDPFSMGRLSGGQLRLPALPNAAWFFFASPENHLAIDDRLPGSGALAGVFRSPPWPAAWVLAGAPALPLLLWPPAARLLRRLARPFVRQQAAALPVDPSEWHEYSLVCDGRQTRFAVDGA